MTQRMAQRSLADIQVYQDHPAAGLGQRFRKVLRHECLAGALAERGQCHNLHLARSAAHECHIRAQYLHRLVDLLVLFAFQTLALTLQVLRIQRH